MKSLILFRHGKASHDYSSYDSDFERDLVKRGRVETLESIQRVIDQGIIPDVILSSPSVRTLQTLEIIANELKFEKEKVLLGSNLYLAAVSQIFNELAELKNKYDSVLLVGHNPALTEIINRCEGVYLDNLPTSGVAQLIFDAHSWTDMDLSNVKLQFIDYPSKHR